MTYDFSIDRKSSIILGGGSLVLMALVFVAGFLAGMGWREPQMAAAQPIPVRAPAAGAPPTAAPKESTSRAESPAPAASAPPPAVKPVEPEPVAAPAAAPPAPPAPATATHALSAAAAATTLPGAPEQSGVRLAIQVGSFREKANAEKLADRLKNSGYTPQISLAAVGAQQWSIVRVGPYQDWDEASQIAAQLSRDQLQAVIRPVR